MFKTKISQRILIVVAVTLLMMALTVSAMAAPGAHELIKPDQLKGLINSNNVVVIDVRSTGYDAGHIPGAVQVNTGGFYEDITFTDADGNEYTVNKMAASPETVAALLGSIGVTPQTHVVIYSSANGTKAATRVWWVLEMYGHNNAQVLEGGFEAWTANGYEISKELVTPTKADYPESKLVVNEDTVATLEEVQAALKKDVMVIDCRTQKVYNDKHIPGTILVPEGDMYNDDNTIKDKQELERYFAEKGITKKTPVITYCNSGTTATVQYLVLTKILGCKDVQNYDGSLNEWDKALGLPIESEPQPTEE